jgi:hypothetical protein
MKKKLETKKEKNYETERRRNLKQRKKESMKQRGKETQKSQKYRNTENNCFQHYCIVLNTRVAMPAFSHFFFQVI